ncbi:hypothetical protein POG22_02680 [Geitlerinema sp. CS-897]|nr:hypothetical protein [Geitlerinema sp. CS-897]
MNFSCLKAHPDRTPAKTYRLTLDREFFTVRRQSMAIARYSWSVAAPAAGGAKVIFVKV